MPLPVPKGVDVTLTGETISVKGSMGTLVRPVNALVTVKNEEGRLLFAPANDSVEADAMSGTMRALVANMVGGVTKGFEKRLALVGVGLPASRAGQQAEPAGRLLASGLEGDAGRRQGRVPEPDRDRHQGFRSPGGRPGRCRGSRVAAARAVQGQGHPLLSARRSSSKRPRRSKERMTC
jgi:hypothetical protein